MRRKVLDLGPAGVIVPLVNSAAEAEAAAKACLYPPEVWPITAIPILYPRPPVRGMPQTRMLPVLVLLFLG